MQFVLHGFSCWPAGGSSRGVFYCLMGIEAAVQRYLHNSTDLLEVQELCLGVTFWCVTGTQATGFQVGSSIYVTEFQSLGSKQRD
jgi:hypothetical protein